MKLTREQRANLYAGNYTALRFPVAYEDTDTDDQRQVKMEEGKPECGVGDRIVVGWQRYRAVYDPELQATFVPTPEPMFWITLTSVAYHAGREEWLVRFDITDRREKRRMVRRKPPAHDMEQQIQDWASPPTGDEVAEAAEESGYTANPESALDPLDAVPQAYGHPELGDLQRRQAKVLRGAQKDRLSIGRQLDSLLEDAKESRQDVRSRSRRIEREVELLKRDLGKAA